MISHSSSPVSKPFAYSGIRNPKTFFDPLQASVRQQLDKSYADTAYDAIVLGVGSMGSAACYYLAKQGVKVLGLEQFEIPHPWGSHSGQSRLIRKAYYEHPNYVPLLNRAYQNWQALEAATETQVYFPTGLLYFAHPDNALMTGVHESATLHQIPLQTLTDELVQSSYPSFALPSYYEKLLEPDAGFVTPERAILLYVQQALSLGAHIRTQEKTLSWHKTGNAYTVRTEKGTYTCEKLVITAGPWASTLIPALTPKLTVTRQVLAWVHPKRPSDFELGKFPCWVIADEEKPGIFYGFPMVPTDPFGGPTGLKVAHHTPGETTTPDTIDRQIHHADEQNLIDFLNKYIPDGYVTTNLLKTCLYTNSPDENFVIDFLPDHNQQVVIAAGFSGHGFKFASAVGEILADLTLTGKTSQPIGFLNYNRLFV